MKLGVQNASTGKKEVDDRHNSIDLTGDEEMGIENNVGIAAKSHKSNTSSIRWIFAQTQSKM